MMVRFWLDAPAGRVFVSFSVLFQIACMLLECDAVHCCRFLSAMRLFRCKLGSFFFFFVILLHTKTHKKTGITVLSRLNYLLYSVVMTEKDEK